MKLENQVVSLELAKRLKELGVKQESLFYWVKASDNTSKILSEDWEIPTIDGNRWTLKDEALAGNHSWHNVYSAFTIAELGEMLPMGSKSSVVNYGKNDDGTVAFKSWAAEWWEIDKDWEYSKDRFASTEADARAKMLIYLLENKLISLPDKEEVGE